MSFIFIYFILFYFIYFFIYFFFLLTFYSAGFDLIHGFEILPDSLGYLKNKIK